MFTGIIENSGVIDAYDKREFGARIHITTTGDEMYVKGESVSVNGVCLTVTASTHSFAADISDETLSRTTLGRLGMGTRVNIERALAMGERLGGHFVQGHVDAIGTLLSIATEGEFAVYRWSFPAGYAPLVVSKGSIAVDGVSLTVVDPDASSFAAALIPETLRRTNLGSAHIGDLVNLEFDVLAKYVRNLVAPYAAGTAT